MSQDRADEWLWVIYILYIDMLANQVEGNVLKPIISVADLGPKWRFCVAGIWGPAGLLEHGLFARVFSSNHWKLPQCYSVPQKARQCLTSRLMRAPENSASACRWPAQNSCSITFGSRKLLGLPDAIIICLLLKASSKKQSHIWDVEVFRWSFLFTSSPSVSLLRYVCTWHLQVTFGVLPW